MDRVRKPKAELEVLCVNALRAKLGMHDLRTVQVIPYSGLQSWTWEVSEFRGDVAPVAFQDAIEEVRKLQQMYDLE